MFLAGALPGLSRSAAAKLLEAGCVSLDGAAVQKSHKTVSGKTYTVVQNEPGQSALAGQDIRLDVVFEDSDVIVVNKPRGMVVHPAPGHPDGTLVNALMFHCGSTLSGIGGILRPGIVHRIDKDTSGLIIAAKNDKAHISLSSQLSDRSLSREYEAIVCGIIKRNCGTINAPIGRHPKDRKRQAVLNSLRARDAVTHYSVISRYDSNNGYGGYTHVSCRLETGRTHQIRVHMSYIGHPLLGDSTYGYKKKSSAVKLDGQCLHAIKLRFIHPSSGEKIELTSPLPDYFIQVLNTLTHP